MELRRVLFRSDLVLIAVLVFEHGGDAIVVSLEFATFLRFLFRHRRRLARQTAQTFDKVMTAIGAQSRAYPGKAIFERGLFCVFVHGLVREVLEQRDIDPDRTSTRLKSSHYCAS